MKKKKKAEMQLSVSMRDKSKVQKHKFVEVKEWKKIHNANNTHKRPGTATLVSVKKDFKTRNITR